MSTLPLCVSRNPIQERCTVVLRIAPTFLRFGSFEIFKTTARRPSPAAPRWSVGVSAGGASCSSAPPSKSRRRPTARPPAAQDRVTGRAGPSAGLEAEILPRMVDFVVEQYYPEIAKAHPAGARVHRWAALEVGRSRPGAGSRGP